MADVPHVHGSKKKNSDMDAVKKTVEELFADDMLTDEEQLGLYNHIKKGSGTVSQVISRPISEPDPASVLPMPPLKRR